MTKKSLNLFVVEDDEHDFEMISRILKKCEFSFEITWFKDGSELLKFLEKNENFIMDNPRKNVFLLDINLPKIDGLELIKKIKGRPSVEDSFVVMLSGSEQKKDLEIARGNGSDYYLVKPFGKDEVKEFSGKINSIFRNFV